MISVFETQDICCVLLHENKSKHMGRLGFFFPPSLFLNSSVLFYGGNLCVQIFS